MLGPRTLMNHYRYLALRTYQQRVRSNGMKGTQYSLNLDEIAREIANRLKPEEEDQIVEENRTERSWERFSQILESQMVPKRERIIRLLGMNIVEYLYTYIRESPPDTPVS